MYFFSQDYQRYQNTIRMVSYLKIILCTIVLIRLVDAENCKDEPKCIMTRELRMKAADCFDKDFINFPKCVPNNVQVLELSYNRLRRVKRSDLSKYSSLRILYLSDNILFSFEEDAFDDLVYLKVLDLSLNAITKIPTRIFQLPSLEKLYLRRNQNMNLDDALDKVGVITSPLAFLDISFTTEEGNNVPEFPNLGILPLVRVLNISNNVYSLTKPRHFAGFCKMTILLADNLTTGYEDPCDCWRINNWLTTRSVTFSPLICPVMNSTCKNMTIDEEAINIYQACEGSYEYFEYSKTIQRVFVGLGSMGSAVLIMLLALYIYRTRQFKKKNNELRDITVRMSLLEALPNRTENEYVL